jgi:hypothetical protein
MLFKEVAKEFSPKVSSCTILCELCKQGYGCRRLQCVPYLRPEHRVKRLEYAKELEYLGLECHHYFIFSDETFIVIGENPNKVYITRSPDEALLPDTSQQTLKKSPLKVMVWACIMLGCKGPLVVLDLPGGLGGGLNLKQYREQVLDCVLSKFHTCMSLEQGAAVFVQDNACCHTSKTNLKWFVDHGIVLVTHPPLSPDLNLIENIWCKLKHIIQSSPQKATTPEKLRCNVIEAWGQLKQENINKYILSMPKQVKAVIQAGALHLHILS